MTDTKKQINPYLAVVLIFMAGLVFTLIVLASINQPSGLDIGSTSATIQK
jgi:hypothetical protein